jgi:hypothetical protein
MRVLALLAFAAATAVSSAWAAMDFVELTAKNIDSQNFEFRFERSNFWADPIITVRVRPKTQKLDEIRDLIGGRLYPCPVSPNQYGLQMTARYPEENAGTLIYRFIVPKTSSSRCFYFWCGGRQLPGGSVWWVNLDSPLVRNMKPQSGRS